MTRAHNKIRGVLFDLDGVLYVDDQAIEGATETVARVRREGFFCRFVTNTTRQTLSTVAEKLGEMGFSIPVEEIITAPKAAALYLKERGSPRSLLVLRDEVKREFAFLPRDEENPEAIVIGDIGDTWDYELMNRLFRLITRGSHFVALHKGRYWESGGGLLLDIGAFVVGLEYATGKQAKIVGKPSREFFDLVLRDMELTASEALMVGDDIESDVGGAQRAGIGGILVKTGKYREELASGSTVRPDHVIESVNELQHILNLR